MRTSINPDGFIPEAAAADTAAHSVTDYARQDPDHVLAVLTTFGVCVAYGGDLEAADTPVSFIDTRSEPCAADTDGVATWVIDTNPPHGTVFTLGN